MQIVVNEQLKDAIEWACKYANEYKVDIVIHIDADGEVSTSVCPTYRDRDTADTPQTDAEIPKNALRSDCTGCRFVGTYDTEFPCANCVRKNKDYYDPK